MSLYIVGNWYTIEFLEDEGQTEYNSVEAANTEEACRKFEEACRRHCRTNIEIIDVYQSNRIQGAIIS